MKKSCVVLARVTLLVLLLFTPLTSSGVLPLSGTVLAVVDGAGLGEGQGMRAKEGSVRPAGRWTTKCDPLINVLRITWTSEIRLEGGIFIIVSEFDNFSEKFGKGSLPKSGGTQSSSVTAFRVMLKPDTIWLEIMSDGSFVPENTGFDQSVVAYAYPGGYEALAKDLNATGIDWENLYLELKASAREIKKTVDETFCPLPQYRREWPKILTG